MIDTSTNLFGITTLLNKAIDVMFGYWALGRSISESVNQGIRKLGIRHKGICNAWFDWPNRWTWVRQMVKTIL